MRSLVALLTALSLLVPLAAAAQERRTNGDTLVSMDYQDMELADVIKAVAKFTGRNFLYDDRVRGRVTVISETPISIDEAYRVFESILQVKGFTAVEGPGDVVKIIPIREAKESPLETVTGEGRAPRRDMFITRLVPLKYVKAETIANTFRPLVSKDANVIAYAPTNTMILTDTSSNVRRLLTILAEIDVKTHQEQVKVIPIEYADAGELAAQLQEIFSEDGSGAAATARRPTRARAQRSGAQQAAAQAALGTTFGSAGKARFITDERTNSIVVLAPATTIRQVERLVVLLDYQRKGTGRIHVYRLQNADAEEMAATLSSFAGGSSGGTAAPTRAPGRPGTGGAAAAQASAVANLEGGVRVTADAPTNSLIIQASAEAFAAIRDVIEDLDLRRPQVMVEALIMEVDVTESQNLGAGFLYRGLMGADDGRQIAVGSANPSLVPDPTNSTQLIPAIATGPGNFATAILGKTIDIVTGTDPVTGLPIVSQVPVIEGLLTASALDDDTNIISAPILLSADNEEALIIVGENIPVPTSRLQTADTGIGGFQTSQNIERQDVGLTLRVTPQISEGDSVRLEIFQETSEVIGGLDSELGPITSNRQVENTVYVKDGEAVMIGGILKETQVETTNKVPWLGDLPILGWAFRGTASEIRKTNLLVVLTPYIVRDPQDLERLTIKQRERFRSAAGASMEWDEDDVEARKKALEAGIDLPLDQNPVRRALDEHTNEYPTEAFPLLESEHARREADRIAEMEAVGRQTGGSYSVQVAALRSPADAAVLLQELLGSGYDGALVSRREGDDSLHSVVLGPYPTEDRAQRIAREIRAETGRQALVIADQ